MMDLVKDERQPLITPYTTAGQFHAPIMEILPYVGISALVDPGAAYTGTLYRFRDLQCTEA